jgi:hypothetical protein
LSQESELITDEMRKAIGVESQPNTVEIDKDVSRRLADMVGDPDPRWRDGTAIFPIALHPGARANRPPVQYQSPARGGGLAGDEWEFLEPIKPGDKLTLTQKVAGFEEREGRQGKVLLTTTQTTYTNQDGKVALIARRTNLGFAPRKEG